jgi:hypothetical protein
MVPGLADGQHLRLLHGQTLELLLASRSIWGTVESQLLLRRLTGVGVCLLLFWSLSPLGGQASLRALRTIERVTFSTFHPVYLYTGLSAGVPWANEIDAPGYQINPIKDLYNFALLSPLEMKLAARDSWGNLRLPRLEFTRQAAGTDSDWSPVPKITSPDQYTSMFGLPIYQLPQGNAANFTVEASYLSLSCSPWQDFAWTEGGWAKYLGITWGAAHYGANPYRPFSRTATAEGVLNVSRREVNYFLDSSPPFLPPGRFFNRPSTPLNDTARVVYFGGYYPTNVSVTACSVTATHMEAAIRCTSGRDCEVGAVRRSLAEKRSSLMTDLDSAKVITYIFEQLPFAFPLGEHVSESDTDKWLMDLESQYGARPFSAVAVDRFAQRLALVLNTFYQLMCCSTSVWTGNPANFGYPLSVAERERARGTRAGHEWWSTTRATQTHRARIYSWHALWLVLLFACSAALLLLGVAGSVVGLRTCAPDMLGYAASMTYNNPYLAIPVPGGAGSGGGGGGRKGAAGMLSAADRVRALADLRVRLADVQGDNSVGHIAFTSSTDVRPLEKGRCYT